ncbi:hypothetical protein O6P37_28100 [Mycobacterium sp. CPCC 205372]|uniref:Transmembrane protein n=2 Tax=Mycobacteriaceae TaxID=1762 RepID=A0A9X2YBH6_9MYCO|nr:MULTISPECIES: hypothetical protein [Mycobacteriaceae]MCV7171517.1 hypothetical protein [[Mycobacterium] manitobense]MCZ8382741.1 hypothetical protein [Mycobacterium hippophais]
MNIIPTRVQEQVDRVERTPSLVLGIFAGMTALWSLYRVFWLLYSASVLSGVGFSAASLIFSAVIWVAVGVGAAVVSAAFLIRYSKQA